MKVATDEHVWAQCVVVVVVVGGKQQVVIAKVFGGLLVVVYVIYASSIRHVASPARILHIIHICVRYTLHLQYTYFFFTKIYNNFVEFTREGPSTIITDTNGSRRAFYNIVYR